jgi:hypothetical protein
MGGIGHSYTIFVRKPKGARLLAGYKHRWEDNITVDIKEVEWRVQTGFIWLRTWSNDEHTNKPSDNIKGREFLE